MKLMVAFASPKRSSKVLAVATQYAKAMDAELVLVRVLAKPSMVGVIAELIATEAPQTKAQSQIDLVVGQLRTEGVNATGILKFGPVADTLVKTARELGAEMMFLGSRQTGDQGFALQARDPIMRYLADKLPVSLCIVRHDLNIPIPDSLKPNLQDEA